MADAPDHPRIWLDPKCCSDADYHIDRCWNRTRPDDCDEPGCGCPPTEYVRADLTPPAEVVDAMERALRMNAEWWRGENIDHRGMITATGDAILKLEAWRDAQ